MIVQHGAGEESTWVSSLIVLPLLQIELLLWATLMDSDMPGVF
jgi:hypothetical protein